VSTRQEKENVMLAQKIQRSVRDIAYRTHGHTGGPITRLVSPSDLGEVIKPFVFLDLAVFQPGEPRMPMQHLWHPHSGIATVTVVLEGSIRYAETTGKAGELQAGGVEWMRAGNGVWHTGEAGPGRARVFQLWVALPPDLENGPTASRYAKPEEVPADGPVRVILGEHAGLNSPIAAPPLTYLHVNLKAGERWSYQPKASETVAWVAVDEGTLRTPSAVTTGELAVFEPSEDSIDFVAQGPTSFVLGAAAQHPHDLYLGNYSVHTSAPALRQGEEEIRRIGRRLRAEGTIR
jgi:redox-sensitive bicupin YhaK (pirin superfamily)